MHGKGFGPESRDSAISEAKKPKYAAFQFGKFHLMIDNEKFNSHKSKRSKNEQK